MSEMNPLFESSSTDTTDSQEVQFHNKRLMRDDSSTYESFESCDPDEGPRSSLQENKLAALAQLQKEKNYEYQAAKIKHS